MCMREARNHQRHRDRQETRCSHQARNLHWAGNPQGLGILLMFVLPHRSKLSRYSGGGGRHEGRETQEEWALCVAWGCYWALAFLRPMGNHGEITSSGIRAHNLQIRSPTPCPLGQGGSIEMWEERYTFHAQLRPRRRLGALPAQAAKARMSR